MLLSFAKGLLSPETLCFHSQNFFFFLCEVFASETQSFLGERKTLAWEAGDEHVLDACLFLKTVASYLAFLTLTLFDWLHHCFWGTANFYIL